MKRLLLSIASVLCLSVAYAQVPTTFSYQGILVDGTGAPVADGLHTVEFDFYSLAAGGTQHYDGFTNNVTTYKGMFTFIIGTGGGNPVIPTNIWDGQVYLQVTADAVVLSPRVQLTSNPYAFKAESANTVVDNAITSVKILDGTIVAADLATDAVTGLKILDATITALDLALDAVTSPKILDGTIAAVDLAAGSVSGGATGTITDGSIIAADLATDAVISSKILDGTIATADLAAGSVTAAKLANTTVTANPYGSATQVATFTVDAQGRLTTAGNTTISGVAPGGTASGDLTGTYPGPTLNTGVVTSTKILDGTIAAADLAASSVSGGTLGTITDASITAADLAASSVSGGTLGTITDASITAADLAAGSVSGGTLGTITDASITAADLAAGSVSGGAIGTITDGSIIAADLATSSVTSAKILDGDIVNADISASAAIDGSKINGSTLTSVSATNITTGTLAVANGGTGATTLTGAVIGNGTSAATAVAGTASQYFRRNAGNTAYEFGTFLATDIPNLDAGKITTGSLPITLGGTGATTAAAARSNLGLIIGTDVQAPISASNGLTRTANDVALGGTLTGNTSIPSAGFNLNFTGAGNMGIGTVGPLSKLDVGGSVAIGNAYAGTSAAPTNGLIIQGNVGLGTTTPANTLDVEGGVAIGTTYSGTTAAPTNGLIVEGTTGIGTLIPFASSKLTVVGASAAGNDAINAQSGSTGASVYAVNSNALGYAVNGWASGGGYAGYFTGRLVVQSGNTGLGVSTPVNKLDVEGGAVIGATYSGTNTAPTNGLLVEGNVGLGITTTTGTKLNINIPSTDASNYTGLFIQNNYPGASTKYGIDVNVDGAGSGSKYGISSSVVGLALDSSPIYGYQLAMTPSGTGTAYGYYSNISSVGTGTREGVQSWVFSGTGNVSTVRGLYGNAQGSGTGTHYGVYGYASGAGLNYAGYFNGNVYATGTITSSDRKLKKDIQPLSGGLDLVMKLKPSTYSFRDDGEFKRMNLPKQKKFGLIAQDVEEVLPSLVSENVQPAEDDNDSETKIGIKGSEIHFKGLNYTELIPILINAIQEQQVQIESMKVEIEALKKK